MREPTAYGLHSDDGQEDRMLSKLMVSVGVVLLASSLAFAGQSPAQSATGNKNVTPDPSVTAQPQSSVHGNSSQTTAPSKHNAAKKHHKHQKKNSASGNQRKNSASGK